MNEKECVRQFLKTFPEYKDEYDDHILQNGKLHIHVFFGEINSLFLRTKLDEPEKAKAYFDYVERMNREGDEAVRKIVRRTILERIKDEPDAWEVFAKTASAEFVQQAQEILEELGRSAQ